MPKNQVEIGGWASFVGHVSVWLKFFSDSAFPAPAAADADDQEFPPGAIHECGDGQHAFFGFNEDYRYAGIPEKICNAWREEEMPTPWLADVFAAIGQWSV